MTKEQRHYYDDAEDFAYGTGSYAPKDKTTDVEPKLDIVDRLLATASQAVGYGEPFTELLCEAAADLKSLKAERDDLKEILETLTSKGTYSTLKTLSERAKTKLSPTLAHQPVNAGWKKAMEEAAQHLDDEAALAIARSETCSDDMVDEFCDRAEYFKEAASSVRALAALKSEGRK